MMTWCNRIVTGTAGFGWWICAGAAFLAAGFGLIALVWFLAGQDRPSAAADWASVLGLPLAYVALVGPGVLWIVRQARAVPGSDPDETVAIRLRRAVRLQWSAEVGARQLEQPRPLRLRWRSTARPVTMAASPSGPNQPDDQLAGALVQDAADPRSPAVALVETFAGLPRRQLVILGEPGAGKTTLVLLYVLAAIDAAGPDDPVPVLLSVAGWDPPRHSIPRTHDALPSLAAGLGIGLLVGQLAGSVIWLLESDPQNAVRIGLIIAVITSVPVGLGRWLSTPVEEAAGSSPESVLRGDRTALLLAAGGVGALTFAASFMILWLLNRSDGLTNHLFAAAVLGGIAAGVVLFGSGATWLSYTVARLWLALWGRLPWRLTHFLRHAHAASVLRQAGPAYQIRHDLLRTYLADRYRPTARWRFGAVIATDPGGAEPRAASPRRRRWRTIVGAAVTLTMVPAAVTLIEPDTQPWATLPHTGLVDALAFHPDGATLTTFGPDFSDDSGVLWSLTQWRLPGDQRIVHRTEFVDSIYDVALSHYGTLVAVSDAMWLWDAAGGQTIRLFSPLELLGPPDLCDPDFDSWDSTITSVSISADGRSVVTGSDRSLLLWPVAAGGEPIPVTCGASWIYSVAVNPDGTKIAASGYGSAASGYGGTVRMWDMATGAATTLPGLESGADNLVFSANGAVLAASNFRTVQMWQVASGVALPPITTVYPAGKALTPDGGIVAAYDGEGILRLWDIATGHHTATLPYRAGRITAAAFSPDGNTLATGSENGVQLWHVPGLVAAQS